MSREAKLQKKQINETISIIEYSCKDMYPPWRSSTRQYVDNIDSLIRSYGGNFDKSAVLSRISHAKEMLSKSSADRLSSAEKDVIMMIMKEIKKLI